MNLLDLSKSDDEIIEFLKLTSNKVQSTMPLMNVDGKPVLTEKQQKQNSQKFEAIESKNYSNNYKLLLINQKILETLQKIERDMIDEQDTSIRKSQIEKNQGLSLEDLKKLLGKFANQPSQNVAQETTLSLPNFDRDKRPKRPKEKPKPKEKKKPKETKQKDKSKKTRPKSKPKGILKTAKNASKGVVKGATRAIAQGAKAIPGLGLAITAGLALYDSVEGWQNAAENLGIDEKNLTTKNKVSSALGSAVSGLTFGLADTSDVSKGINNFLGGNSTIEQYEKLGIIEHNTFGNSEIKDWDKLASLSKEEIQKIIDIDDWSEDDLNRLNQIKNNPNAFVKQDDIQKVISETKTAVKTQETSKNELGKFDKSQVTANTKSSDLMNLTKSDIVALIESTTDGILRQRLKALQKTQTGIDAVADSIKNKSKSEQKEFLMPFFEDAMKRSKSAIEANNTFKANIWSDYAEYVLKTIKRLKGVNETQKEFKPIFSNLNANMQKMQTSGGYSSFALSGFNFPSFGMSNVSVSSFVPFTLTPSDATFNPDDGISALSKKYEVGNGGPGTISSGKGDPGGKSYGSWQLSSNAGTLDAFVKQAQGEIGEQLRKYPITSSDFDKAWKMIAEQDPKGFEKMQYDFLYKSNFLPVLNHANSLGIDTSLTTIKNVLWSQSIQHGLEGNKKILNNAVAKVGKNASPESMINAIYNSRSEYVNGLSSMNSSTKHNVLNRYKQEGADALAMLRAEQKGELKPVKEEPTNFVTASYQEPAQYAQPETNKTYSELKIDETNKTLQNSYNIINNVNVINNNSIQQNEKTADENNFTKEEDLNSIFVTQGDDF